MSSANKSPSRTLAPVTTPPAPKRKRAPAMSEVDRVCRELAWNQIEEDDLIIARALIAYYIKFSEDMQGRSVILAFAEAWAKRDPDSGINFESVDQARCYILLYIRKLKRVFGETKLSKIEKIKVFLSPELGVLRVVNLYKYTLALEAANVLFFRTVSRLDPTSPHLNWYPKGMPIPEGKERYAISNLDGGYYPTIDEAFYFLKEHLSNFIECDPWEKLLTPIWQPCSGFADLLS